MTSDVHVEFVDRCYGKNYVRLLHVQRDGNRHTVKELEVDTKLTLATTKDYELGDNSDIIATDSQKNTVYILAKRFGVPSIEEFALKLSSHFLDTYPHVIKAQVYIEERSWKRIEMNGVDHSHAFIESPECTRFCRVIHDINDSPKLSAGLKDMKIMKTTKSAFVNFVRDEYRSLPDMKDRVFCTVVFSEWRYQDIVGLDFDQSWNEVRDTVLEVFAGPPTKGVFSPSVQKTLYDTQKLVMARIPQISQMRMELPNVHAYKFDFSKHPDAGIENNEEVFQPTDKPSGNIQATLRRKPASKL